MIDFTIERGEKKEFEKNRKGPIDYRPKSLLFVKGSKIDLRRLMIFIATKEILPRLSGLYISARPTASEYFWLDQGEDEGEIGWRSRMVATKRSFDGRERKEEREM